MTAEDPEVLSKDHLQLLTHPSDVCHPQESSLAPSPSPISYQYPDLGKALPPFEPLVPSLAE